MDYAVSSIETTWLFNTVSIITQSLRILLKISPIFLGTCNDGIMNHGETGIDCGGPCADCCK